MRADARTSESPMLTRRRIAVLGAASLCGVLVTFSPILDKLVLFPSRHALESHGALPRRVAFAG